MGGDRAKEVKEKSKEEEDSLIWGICSCSGDGYPSCSLVNRRGEQGNKTREMGSVSAEASGQRFHDGALVCLSARLSEHWTLSDQNASMSICAYMSCMCEHQLLHVQALAMSISK